MKPSIGRIVHYLLTTEDADQINRRRVGGAGFAAAQNPNWPAGAQAHVGNQAHSGERVAMIVTAVFGDTIVNGQVVLDGNDSLWVTSRMRGDSPGNWNWPERVE